MILDQDNARNVLINGCVKLKKEGLTAGTWGNISLRLSNEHMLITPSGMDYEEMVEDDLVLVNLATAKCTGKRKPSTETGTHMAIYNARKDVNAIIHTHSLYASVVAAANREIPPILEDMAQIIGESIRIAPHHLPGSPELQECAVEALENRFAVLLQAHGAICIGRDLSEAFTVCEVMEKSCHAYILTELLGGGHALPAQMAKGFRDYYLTKYIVKE